MGCASPETAWMYPQMAGSKMSLQSGGSQLADGGCVPAPPGQTWKAIPDPSGAGQNMVVLMTPEPPVAGVQPLYFAPSQMVDKEGNHPSLAPASAPPIAPGNDDTTRPPPGMNAW